MSATSFVFTFNTFLNSVFLTPNLIIDKIFTGKFAFFSFNAILQPVTLAVTIRKTFMTCPTTSTTLLQRLCGGEEIAFAEFQVRYRSFINGIARRIGLSDADGEEIFQQTMVRIFQDRLVARFDRKKGAFHSFLYSVVKNLCYDFIRKRLRKCELSDWDDAAFETAFDAEYHQYILTLLLDELKTLVEPETFEAFYLVVIRELAPKDVAKLLDISIDSVYQAKSRCVKHLTHLAKLFQQTDPEFKL